MEFKVDRRFKVPPPQYTLSPAVEVEPLRDTLRESTLQPTEDGIVMSVQASSILYPGGATPCH